MSRRTVAGLAGMAGVSLPLLAACGGGGNSDSSTGTDAGSTDTQSSTSPSSGGSTSSGGGSALAATSDIPVGGGKIFPDEKVVVTQPKSGEFKGFSSTCTHQGCQVAKVADGTIDCPCHGSMYSITDGSVQGGPAPSPLPAVKLTVSGTEISLA